MRQDLLGRLDLPIVAAPMFLVSGPELVIAASRSGILGAFPAANCRDIEELDRWMERISVSLAAGELERPWPWAVNLVTHRSNSMFGAQLDCVAKYRPPVVTSAMGSPKPVLEVVTAYGGLVLADVTTIALAYKAIDAGVDGLICVSSGAGGHTGDLSPFAFVSAVRKVFEGLVAVAGGIGDGFGVAAAIAAGADLAVLGTRFIATNESLASAAYRQMLIESGSADIVVSSGITGAPASWLRPSLLANGLDPDDLPALRHVDVSARPNRWSEIWSAGHGVHAIRAVEPVATVVSELEKEFRQSARRLTLIGAGSPQGQLRHRGGVA